MPSSPLFKTAPGTIFTNSIYVLDAPCAARTRHLKALGVVSVPSDTALPSIFTKTSRGYHCQFEWARIPSTRFRRMSLTNIGPNLFHQNLMVSRRTSMPRSAASPRRSGGKAKTDVRHRRQPDDLWRRLEIAKRVWFRHRKGPAGHPARLKPISSDRAKPASGRSNRTN